MRVTRKLGLLVGLPLVAVVGFCIAPVCGWWLPHGGGVGLRPTGGWPAAATCSVAGNRRAGMRVTMPEVLVVAAGRLAFWGGPVVSTDLCDVLVETVADLAPQLDAVERRGLVDEVRQALCQFLLVVREAEPDQRTGLVLQGWMLGQTVDGVRRGLCAAARFWSQQVGSGAACEPSSPGRRVVGLPSVERY